MSVPYQSKKRLSMLKGRVERCVCRSCGGRLSLRLIDFNDFEEARIEIFCEQCDRLEFGIEPEIFVSAQYYVDEFDINFYPDLGVNAVTRKMSIANITDIMSWALQNMEYLNKDGFLVAPNLEAKVLGECIVLNDETIDLLEEGLDL